MKTKLCSLLLTVFLLGQVTAKYASCYPDFTQHDRWIFCTKMAFGHAKVAEVTHLNYYLTHYSTVEGSNYQNLQMLVLDVDNWSKVHEERKDNVSCERMKELSLFQMPIQQEGFSTDEDDDSEPINMMIEYSSQVWFFVLADCSFESKNDPKLQESSQRYGAKVQLIALNGDSHFSEEECGMLRDLAIAGAFFLVAMIASGFKFLGDIGEYDLETMKNPLMLIIVSLSMTFAKIVMQLMHLAIYSYNGSGFFPFKFFATYIFVMSQCMLSLVFVGLAFGMGLKDSTLTRVLFSGEVEMKLQDEIKVFASLVTIILCHAIIAVAIFYDHEEDHKFHDWQGTQGHLLCILRLVIFGAFLFALCTRKKNDNPRETHYMNIVTFAGTLYLLSLPIVVVFTNYALETVSQQVFIVFGSFACQMAAVGVLFYQFTVKHSAYYEISYKSQSFMPTSGDKQS